MAESTASRTPTTLGNRQVRKLAVIVLVCLSIPIGIYAYLFQSGVLGDPEFHDRFAEMPLMAAFHMLGGGTILIIGGFQFVAGIRSRRITLHRWLGRAYLIGVLIGGVGGLALATNAAGGPVGRIGFGLLAIVWLFSGACGYRAIRRGDISRHRRWVMRNYALAFAAVTLRIQLPVLQSGFGLSFEEAYPVVAWLSWVPNLILVDWLMRGQSSPGPGSQSVASSA